MSDKRYYSPVNDGTYVTPSSLKRLSRARQLEYVVHWFRTMYWDPANDTPYNSREGGYQYLHGGPFDATEEISSEFDGVAHQNVLEEAVEIVQRECFDWEASPNHPNRLTEFRGYAQAGEPHAQAGEPHTQATKWGTAKWGDKWSEPKFSSAFSDEFQKNSLEEIERKLDSGVTPKFGTDAEVQSRSFLESALTEIRSEITALRDELQNSRPVHGGIGHNNPPEAIDIDYEYKQLSSLDNNLKGIQEEIKSEKPNAKKVTKFAKAVESILSSAAKKFDIATDEFAKEFGGELGKWSGRAIPATFFLKLSDVYDAVLQWLSTVVM